MANYLPQRNTILSKRKQRGWLGFFIGLALGLFVAVLVYLQGAGVRSPNSTNGKPSDQLKSPAAVAEQPTAAPPTKSPKFDFYTILPESEVKISEPEGGKSQLPTNVASATQTESRSSASKGGGSKERASNAAVQYSLQIGSFQKRDEAERVKAKLALLGLSAEVHSVMVNGDEPWFRVMAGPFADASHLQAARKRLDDNNLNYMIVKQKN